MQAGLPQMHDTLIKLPNYQLRLIQSSAYEKNPPVTIELTKLSRSQTAADCCMCRLKAALHV